jgi:ABC-2 type transport system ATP-binding protein
MIACQAVTKTFRDKRALHDVSITVQPGRLFALLGRNGAGKSTLLKILTGQLSADSGSIQVLGQYLPAAGSKIRRHIGVLPEGLGLFDDLSVLEHLDLSGKIYGLSRKERSTRIEELLDALDLEHGRNTLARNCSHGMRKKTALALALLHNPQVVFLDEPFEGIDPIAVRGIRGILSQMAQRGATILLTAHTFSLLEGFASEAVILHEGRVVYRSQSGSDLSEIGDIFFSISEAPPVPQLQWLGSRQS